MSSNDAYGTPLAHRTDNGPPFNAEKFTEFSREQGIRHDKAYPYHPQANLSECFMKPLGKAMKIAHLEGKNKKKALGEFLTNFRATPHSFTGMAPGDILLRYGFSKDFPRQYLPDDKDIREALESDNQRRTKRDLAKNESRTLPSYKIGDSVLTRNNNKSHKFDPLFNENLLGKVLRFYPLTIISCKID